MELVNKFLEKEIDSSNDKINTILINGFKHQFLSRRIFEDNIYKKTINIIILNGKLLEDKDYYVSFTNETKDLDISNTYKYSYGLFIKHNLPISDNYIMELNGQYIENGIYYPNSNYFYYYSTEFLEDNNNYPYIGIDLNPEKKISLASFIVKSRNKNIIVCEEQEFFDDITKPRLFLKNNRDLFEDEELIL